MITSTQEVSTQEQAFINAIVSTPEDMDLRLIYADWLEEHGREERAELIRVQILLSSHKYSTLAGRPRMGRSRVRNLKHREKELLKTAHGNRSTNVSNYSLWLGPLWKELLIANCSWDYRRGFVEVVRCTLHTWLKSGPSLVRMQPILEVNLIDRDPDQSHVGPNQWSWWNDGRFKDRSFYLDEPNDLPHEIWIRLENWKMLHPLGEFRHYPSREAANGALSTAAVLWARDEPVKEE